MDKSFPSDQSRDQSGVRLKIPPRSRSTSPLQTKKLSIVVPVLNEAESIPTLVDEIRSVAQSESNLLDPNSLELIVIDDGSTDDSWKVIKSLAEKHEFLKGIRFRKNYGKAAALSYAFNLSEGEYVVTLDGDLQDCPSEIPGVIGKLDEGFDVVCGWKKRRMDPLGKIIFSKLFNYFVNRASGLALHDHNCGLKGYRAEVVKNLFLYGELHRFITLLAHSQGFSVCELAVTHRPRSFGHSKFGSVRLLRGMLDFLTIRFLTVYEERPLHLFGGLGLLLLVLGGLGLVYLAILWVLGYRPVGTRPLLTYSVAELLFGGQLLGFGILAELITWKFHSQGPSRPTIADTIGLAQPSN